MIYEGRAYTVLVVSSSEKMNEALKSMLTGGDYSTVRFTGNVSAAKRLINENAYDFVIINSPLPDDLGTKLAIDVASSRNSVCLQMVKSDLFEDVYRKNMVHGVFLTPKPTSTAIMLQALKWMAAARERLRNLTEKTVSIEGKMEEIRLVNRAKWILIENESMTEPQAHRYIEKRAMDTSKSKCDIANAIIEKYTP